MQLGGRHVLLTGATGGLGRAIARELASHGARLLLTGRRSVALDDLADELGRGARGLAVDLGRPGDVEHLAAEAGQVDVLVANAALPGSGRLASFEPAQIDAALDVNLRAPMQLARALSPAMVERGRGQLVFVSSLSGKAATTGSSVYSATKFALRGFSLALRSELAGTGVGVSCVFPGFIRGAGMFHESGTVLPWFAGTKTPEDVGRAVARAIERDLAEVDVAPLGLRLGATFAGLAPETADAVNRRLGADRVAEDIAAGQAHKRG